MNTTPPVSPQLDGLEITEAIMSRPTTRIRAKIGATKRFLIRVEELTHDLASASSEEQRKIMQEIVLIYQNEIRHLSEWEECKLYPAVDKRASSGIAPFTSSMRCEHQIAMRWISELEIETRLRYPEERRFTQLTYQLLGLLKAHIEEEELVLLPILDKTMSAEQLNEEIYDSIEEIKRKN